MEIFYVLLLFIAAYFQSCLPLKTYLSKVDCVALNKQKIIFEYCLLQTDGHNVTTMSLKFRQLYGVVDDIKGHLKYTRRFNRSQQHRSIMSPIKFDFCKPFSNDMNPLIHASFALWQPYINVNHTCPLSQKAVIIHKFVTDERIFFWLPLQKGEYAIYITLFLYDVPSFSINLYFLIND